MNKQIWTLYFDGLCEPVNPGGTMSYGWILRYGEKVLTGADACDPSRGNTNNVAEYMALGYGIRAVLNLIAREPDAKAAFGGLLIRGDSKLVVEQVNARWKVKSERLHAVHARVIELLNMTGKPWTLEWIGREGNAEADELSRNAYREATGKEAPDRSRKSA